MSTLPESIHLHAQTLAEGGVLSPKEFLHLGSRAAIDQALSRLTKEGRLITGQADFLKASAHWLRHTFAHQALAGSDRDLAAVQQILGHADIGTTGIYVKADLADRVAAVEGLRGRFELCCQ